MFSTQRGSSGYLAVLKHLDDLLVSARPLVRGYVTIQEDEEKREENDDEGEDMVGWCSWLVGWFGWLVLLVGGGVTDGWMDGFRLISFSH